MQKVTSLNDFKKNSVKNWKLIIDGKARVVKKRLSLINEHFGRLDYAESPLGFDTISFEEIGRGGSVIVPYFYHENELFIGLVEEDRPNMSGNGVDFRVFNLPRGLVERNETFFHAAKREFQEEMQILLKEDHFILKKLSKPLNPDSALFYSSMGKSGVEFFSIKVPFKLMEQERRNVYKFKDEYVHPECNTAEKIYCSRFYHWSKIFDLYDMLTVTGVLLLRISLEHTR